MYMNVNERIKDQLDNNPVILYMKGTPNRSGVGRLWR
jgi:glutaredoxin-related protein